MILVLSSTDLYSQHFFNSIDFDGFISLAVSEHDGTYLMVEMQYPGIEFRPMQLTIVNSQGEEQESIVVDSLFFSAFPGNLLKIAENKHLFVCYSGLQSYTAQMLFFDLSSNEVNVQSYNFPTNNNTAFHNVSFSNDSSYLLNTGIIRVGGLLKPIFVKTDLEGNAILQRSYYMNSTLEYQPRTVMETNLNSFIIAGNVSEFLPNNNFRTFYPLIFCIDSLGNPIWEMKYGSQINNSHAVSCHTTDGHFVAASGYGVEVHSAFGTNEYWKGRVQVRKFDEFGNILWDKQFGSLTNLYAFPESIVLDEEGDILVTGHSFGAESEEAFILKINQSGDSLWMKNYTIREGNDGSVENTRLFNIIPTSDNGLLCGGRYFTGSGTVFPNGKQSSWLMHLDCNGEMLNCDGFPVILDKDLIVDDIEVQIYPNPAIESIRIELSHFLKFNKIALNVFCLNTKKSILSERIRLEEGDLDIDVTSWSSGIYIFNFNANKISYNRKVIVLPR